MPQLGGTEPVTGYPWTTMRLTHALAGGALAAAFLSTLPALAQCPGDLDASGTVDGADLGVLLGAWGCTGACPGDLSQDSVVDGTDLGLMLAAWGECPPSTPASEAPLAAVTLAAWPWASWVDTYNSNGGVGIAIDPGQHPELAGRAALLWVVEDRSPSQWAADPTLSDARPTGPQSVTCPSGSIQGTVIALNSAGLVAGSGDAPARGYDLVLDMDQDGTLSPGDLVDGRDGGAGFWWTRDIAALGPYSTASIASHDVNDADILDSMELERVYYPTNAPGLRPIVAISHGNGHNYAWYDYLGNHLASWGFVVMSHQNDTVPGIASATVTTVEHTESFIDQHATMGGGVLAGKVDIDRIAWIGHSRGGESVTYGYDRLFDGTFTSPSYGLSDIKCVIAIAPTDFLGTASANPHAVPYMLLYGAADGDVCGCPDSDIADSFNLYERATGLRHSTYVHGADHNDFNCCGINDFNGPAGTAIGSTLAQSVAKASILAMVRRSMFNDRAMEEFLWRQNESLRAIGQSATVTVVREFKPAAGVASPIDDFQSNTTTTVSTSGGAVNAIGLSNLIEALANDNNITFTWATTDAWNGAVRNRTTDSSRAGAFDWTTAGSITWSVPSSLADFTKAQALSFRAAQGTRHPNTVAALGDLDLTVTLRDTNGIERSIRIGTLGGGIEEPYQRTGFGTGTGWQAEFESVRIVLDDLLSGGGAFDLSSIATVQFRVGGADGSAQGRLLIDDLILENE